MSKIAFRRELILLEPQRTKEPRSSSMNMVKVRNLDRKIDTINEDKIIIGDNKDVLITGHLDSDILVGVNTKIYVKGNILGDIIQIGEGSHVYTEQSHYGEANRIDGFLHESEKIDL